METVLTTHFANERYRRLDTYRQYGGYEALKKALRDDAAKRSSTR